MCLYLCFLSASAHTKQLSVLMCFEQQRGLRVCPGNTVHSTFTSTSSYVLMIFGGMLNVLQCSLYCELVSGLFITMISTISSNVQSDRYGFYAGPQREIVESGTEHSSQAAGVIVLRPSLESGLLVEMTIAFHLTLSIQAPLESGPGTIGSVVPPFK